MNHLDLEVMRSVKTTEAQIAATNEQIEENEELAVRGE